MPLPADKGRFEASLAQKARGQKVQQNATHGSAAGLLFLAAGDQSLPSPTPPSMDMPERSSASALASRVTQTRVR